jgi:hypothetical protein
MAPMLAAEAPTAAVTVLAALATGAAAVANND